MAAQCSRGCGDDLQLRPGLPARKLAPVHSMEVPRRGLWLWRCENALLHLSGGRVCTQKGVQIRTRTHAYPHSHSHTHTHTNTHTATHTHIHTQPHSHVACDCRKNRSWRLVAQSQTTASSFSYPNQGHSHSLHQRRSVERLQVGENASWTGATPQSESRVHPHYNGSKAQTPPCFEDTCTEAETGLKTVP